MTFLWYYTNLDTSDFDTETDVEILNFVFNIMPVSICGKATSNHKNKTRLFKNAYSSGIVRVLAMAVIGTHGLQSPNICLERVL